MVRPNIDRIKETVGRKDVEINYPGLALGLIEYVALMDAIMNRKPEIDKNE